jgi:drug/metabolite transporter (DMT)-like permease
MNRHLFYFIALGLVWGLSPSQYRYWGETGMPVTHIMVYTGIGVGVALACAARLTSGRFRYSRAIVLYGLGCALLMNVPFGSSLFFARHVPATELALIMSTAPFFNYLVALLTGREIATSRRLAAVAAGFLSSAVLILTRGSTTAGGMSWWTLAAFSSPLMYTAYNWFAARHWPRGADTLAVGAAESMWSGLTMIPLMLIAAPPWSPDSPPAFAYWSIALAIVLWIVERISFFTLIRDKGAVYTIQAIYLATPAAVVFAALFFGGAADFWLWVSLAILMPALWLNNSGTAATPRSA